MLKITCESCLDKIEFDISEVYVVDGIFLVECPICNETNEIDEEKLTQAQIKKVLATQYEPIDDSKEEDPNEF